MAQPTVHYCPFKDLEHAGEGDRDNRFRLVHCRDGGCLDAITVKELDNLFCFHRRDSFLKTTWENGRTISGDDKWHIIIY